MSRDLNVSESGAFQVKQVDPSGTYDSATLTATDGGSIHVLGDLRVNGPITLVADNSATILLPKTVTCTSLKLQNSHSSTINSNDIEVTEASPVSPSSLNLEVDNSSTAGLYLQVAPQQANGDVEIAGKVTSASTLNLWLHVADGGKLTDKITADYSSLYTRRGWSGP